jgi:FKBP-type peptidyl-prolyl cis-trans isomerase FklB
MKRTIALSAAFLLVAAAGFAGAQEAGQPAPGKPESLQDKASYVIGFNLGQALKSQQIDVTADLIVKGLRDGLGGAEAMFTPEEIQAVMSEFQQQTAAQQQARAAAAATENQKKSKEFLAENQKREGVTTLPSGLQYEELQQGSGAKPAASDRVKVHYEGKLVDGTVFDSSVQRGQPVEFGVDQVIAGWTEALQLMNVGDKWKIYIPPSLGYGEQGAGQVIGPNQALVFEVELLEIVSQQPAAAPDAPATPATVEPPTESEEPPSE